jgi:hypothetical protein
MQPGGERDSTPLERAAARLARSEAPELLNEARDEARAEAKSLLKDLMLRAYLQESTRHLQDLDLQSSRTPVFEEGEEPSANGARAEESPDQLPDVPDGASEDRGLRPDQPFERAAGDDLGRGRAIYAYGVVGNDSALELEGVPSIDGSHSLRLVATNDVRALVSTVSTSEFSEGVLRDRLENLEWLRTHVAAHERVQREAFRQTQILPFRFLTIYRDEQSLRDVLSARAEEFRTMLTSLEGMVELGVRVSFDRQSVAASVEEGDWANANLAQDHATQGQGRSYLVSRKVADDVNRTVAEVAERQALMIHDECCQLAARAVILKAQDNRLAGRKDEVILNAAYLVSRARADDIATLIRDRNQSAAGRGFKLEVTGPWPPYNFVSPEVFVG